MNNDTGERLRASLGIDGTAGDAQDVDHDYRTSATEPDGPCLVCGLAQPYRRHTGYQEIAADLQR
ncbi:hypothetical protein GCM10011608_10920 [Micromonospora sonchi]|uniref:Uncharacterized protein n=1 Tax=Micromonospora sonchi TaxID=1763543 RepID=A0A917TLQ7_9ACTN|nr:hypothetical protein [Micromonospora sonchi]GGM27900.1 hypothetical protein GCM10011608_10920 [Micromonospora sonchi]